MLISCNKQQADLPENCDGVDCLPTSHAFIKVRSMNGSNLMEGPNAYDSSKIRVYEMKGYRLRYLQTSIYLSSSADQGFYVSFPISSKPEKLLFRFAHLDEDVADVTYRKVTEGCCQGVYIETFKLKNTSIQKSDFVIEK